MSLYTCYIIVSSREQQQNTAQTMKGVIKMKFYRARREAHDYFTGNTVIANELVTQRERDTKFRYISDFIFEEVEVSKKKTFWNFGARFECTE